MAKDPVVPANPDPAPAPAAAAVMAGATYVRVKDGFSINGADFLPGRVLTRDEYVNEAKMAGSFEGRIQSGWLELITPEQAAEAIASPDA